MLGNHCSVEGRAELPAASATLANATGSSEPLAFSVALCVCANYRSKAEFDACTVLSDYVQPVGVAHFWRLAVTDPGATNCIRTGRFEAPQYLPTPEYLRHFRVFNICR